MCSALFSLFPPLPFLPARLWNRSDPMMNPWKRNLPCSIHLPAGVLLFVRLLSWSSAKRLSLVTPASCHGFLQNTEGQPGVKQSKWKQSLHIYMRLQYLFAETEKCWWRAVKDWHWALFLWSSVGAAKRSKAREVFGRVAIKRKEIRNNKIKDWTPQPKRKQTFTVKLVLSKLITHDSAISAWTTRTHRVVSFLGFFQWLLPACESTTCLSKAEQWEMVSF